MSAAPRERGADARTDLRNVDEHASWRDVYFACSVEVAGHE